MARDGVWMAEVPFYGGGLPLEIPQTIACSTVFVLYSDPLLECCLYMLRCHYYLLDNVISALLPTCAGKTLIGDQALHA